jgi:hypothetical protein
MKDEYIIINKTAILKRIEELEGTDTASWEYQLGQIKELKQILSQSTSLTSEIEKAFNASKITTGMNQRNQFAYKYKNSKDYISNLKLDI